MNDFDFYAIQSSSSDSDVNWFTETVASNLNDLAYTYRLLRLTKFDNFYRVVHISFKTEVVVSHKSKILGDRP